MGKAFPGAGSSGAFTQGFVASKMPANIDSLRVGPGERLDYWKHEVSSHNGLEIFCQTSNFQAQMKTKALGLCSVHGVQIATPHKARRAASGEDLCFANIQLRNEGARFNGHREFVIPQGSMVLYEAATPYELDFDGASESLVLAIPKSELQKRMTSLQHHLDEAIIYDCQKVAMLAELMRGLLNLPDELRQSVMDSLAESVVNMLVATLYDCKETASATPTFGTAATLNRIKAHIKANIEDPDLNPVKTSQAMGITVSYLHKIFLQNNTTMMQYVLAERLELCRRDIAKADRSGGISQVAYGWGFNDASHFSRSFRKRFGVSPREYRAQVLERDARLKPENG